MSTYYPSNGVSSCEIAGAVALAAIRDLRVNLFSFSGFPQIYVSDLANEIFTITLSFPNQSNRISEVAFELDKEIAFAAAKRFKKDNSHDANIFEAVQSALAKLESECSKYS